ncbi:MAG: hypothetical protein KBT06_10670 [Prevotellaceae bacterium]|nr:hypothetical protein [Candidatus Colivivens equi]
MEQIKQYSTFIGYLSEKKLIKKRGTVSKTSTIACDIISGTIAVETENNSVHYLNVYCTSKTAKGNEHPFWQSIDTMYNEYKSKKDVAAHEAEYASYICVNATPAINDFVDKSGNVVVGRTKYSVNTVKRVDPSTPTVARVNLGGYLNSVRDEIENDEETGRKIMEIVGIDYFGNAEPFTVYVGEENDGYFDYWEIGDKVNAECVIVNHMTADPSAPTTTHNGRPLKSRSEKRITLFDWLDNRVDDDEIREQNMIDVRKALEARKLKIEALRSKSTETPHPATAPVNIEFDDDEECPF